MKRKLLIFIFIFYCTITIAQKRGNIWCFGDSAGIDFNFNPPQPITSSVNARGSCASIADTTGSLLFYAQTYYWPYWSIGYLNATVVWDRNNNIMLNGDSIIGEVWYQELCITPKPNDNNKFYLFSLGTVVTQGIYCSVIDMNLNGSNGAIIQKNLLIDSLDEMGGLTAIKHGNGRDWWLIIHDWNGGNTFYKFLVTPSGISGAFIQSTGSGINSDLSFLKTSPDGSKLMIVDYFGLLQVFDFDRCTGNLSNPITASNENIVNPKKYCGISMSPNKRFVYVSNVDTYNYELDQFDITAANVPASKVIISQFTSPCAGGFHQLATDGKIYISHYYDQGYYPYPDSIHNQYVENLSVINEPDSLGAACNFQPFSFYLGGNRAYWGLPNNPNYDLGSLIGSGCDTLTGVPDIKHQESKPELFVTYVNSWNKIFVNAQHLLGKNCELQLIDINGKEIYSSFKTTTPPYFMQEISLFGFTSGMYVVKLITEKETLSKKFVKQ